MRAEVYVDEAYYTYDSDTDTWHKNGQALTKEEARVLNLEAFVPREAAKFAEYVAFFYSDTFLEEVEEFKYK